MLKREINEVFNLYSKRLTKIFKSVFILKKGPDGYYYENKLERIYCPNRLMEYMEFIGQVRFELLKINNPFE